MSDSSNPIEKKIKTASYLLMASVLISRVIGFFREWVLAQTLGASKLTDVYYASFTVPDFLNYLMAAGALSISFIPVLSDYLASDREAEGKRVFRFISTVLVGMLLTAVIVAEIFAAHLGEWIAPGFDAEQRQTLTQLLRIILPAQLFFLWGGLAISVQQTHGKFIYYALAPIIYNSCIIVCGIVLEPVLGISSFSVGVLIGAILGHGVLQWWGIHRLGYSCLPLFHPTPELKSALRRYFVLSLPIMLGLSLVATDEWISKYFASFLEGPAVSWLNYARTSVRVPIAVIGQVAGVVSFPYLARLWAAKQYEDFAGILFREISKLWFLTILATLIFYFHALPIIHFLFGGGRLTSVDLAFTAEGAKWMALALFFWTSQVLLARAFYACKITWLPSLIGTLLSFCFIPIYKILMDRFGFTGLAMAGSFGVMTYALLLAIFLKRQLKKVSLNFRLGAAAGFLTKSSAILILSGVLVWASAQSGLYHGDRMSALWQILLACAAGGVPAFLLQKLFKRPLF